MGLLRLSSEKIEQDADRKDSFSHLYLDNWWVLRSNLFDFSCNDRCFAKLVYVLTLLVIVLSPIVTLISGIFCLQNRNPHAIYLYILSLNSTNVILRRNEIIFSASLFHVIKSTCFDKTVSSNFTAFSI